VCSAQILCALIACARSDPVSSAQTLCALNACARSDPVCSECLCVLKSYVLSPLCSPVEYKAEWKVKPPVIFTTRLLTHVFYGDGITPPCCALCCSTGVVQVGCCCLALSTDDQEMLQPSLQAAALREASLLVLPLLPQGVLTMLSQKDPCCL